MVEMARPPDHLHYISQDRTRRPRADSSRVIWFVTKYSPILAPILSRVIVQANQRSTMIRDCIKDIPTIRLSYRSHGKSVMRLVIDATAAG